LPLLSLAASAWYSRAIHQSSQRKAVADYLNGGKWTLAAEFVEIESGKRSDNRPQLAAALAACKKQRAKLVVAKLDRLSRNMAFIATMMDSGVEFVAVDNPHATRLTLHILAAVAEHERTLISQRTKAALVAAKAIGRKLGGPKARRRHQPRQQGQRRRRRSFRRQRRADHPGDQSDRRYILAGCSRGADGPLIATARGGEVNPAQVANVLKREQLNKNQQ
jgi:DNA invertase Pin-like site-specific DNA recombinase